MMIGRRRHGRRLLIPLSSLYLLFGFLFHFFSYSFPFFYWFIIIKIRSVCEWSVKQRSLGVKTAVRFTVSWTAISGYQPSIRCVVTGLQVQLGSNSIDPISIRVAIIRLG